ncbi:MAG: hypothetical protein ACE37H_16835 [Phycisphaeraceae bacterium]
MSQFPPPTSQPQPPMGPAPEDRVNGPAIALMVTAGIGIALAIVGLLLNLLGAGVGAAQGGDEGAINMMSGGVGVIQSIVGIAVGVVILMGAMKMKRLESHGFALTAAILAMIPCVSPCCLLGLPFGIWAIVVLNDANVKAAFR